MIAFLNIAFVSFKLKTQLSQDTVL